MKKLHLTLITLLISLSVFSAPKPEAPQINAEKIGQIDIDPDTLDEEELQALRDTITRSRQNLADESGTLNALDYLLDDRYVANHETFAKGFFSNLYASIGGGFEGYSSPAKYFKMKTLSHMNVALGKQFTTRSSLRLALAGAWGFQEEKEKAMVRYSGKADYIFDLSSNLFGYQSNRRVNISSIIGVGGSYVKLQREKRIYAPECHVGLQFRLATGPEGFFNIEPYCGITIDNIGDAKKYNWRTYDLFWGINLNYTYYLSPHLSNEARLRMLQQRAADDRVIDSRTVETWRTPWFVSASSAFAMGGGENVDFSKTMGHQTKLTVGRWLSPVIGIRASALSRISTWHENTVEAEGGHAGYVHNYSHNYVGLQGQAMFNPLGFLKSFNWDSRFGMYFALGYSGGRITKYIPGATKLNTYYQGYDVGLHLWTRLSEDLQFFIEPEFSHSRYLTPYNNANWNRMFNDNLYNINIGVTMMMRSYKFEELDKMDRMQNFTYRNIKGFRVGLAGGMTLMQTKDYLDNNGGFKWAGMAYAEYRFNFLHSIRLQEDVLAIKSNNIRTYKDVYAYGTENASYVTREGVWQTTDLVSLTSLDYEISLTNLCSGRKRYRTFDLEAYAGPTFGWVFNSKETLNSAETVPTENHTLIPPSNDFRQTMWGMNVGLKLSSEIFKGFSFVVMPTMYMLNGQNLENSLSLGDFHLCQSINIGLQYKIGSYRPTAAKRRTKYIQQQADWARKLAESNAKYNAKMERKLEKKRAKVQKKMDKLKSQRNRKY